jgi:hypothetical protein
MALIPVINNHTGDEGEVDETWLERWPEDFTPADGDHVAAAPVEDPAPDPVTEEPPSDGTTEEIN